MNTKGNLIFFVTEDWYFAMHFLHFAVAAQNDGWSVRIICNVGQKGTHALEQIEKANLEIIYLPLSRSSITPLTDLRAFFKVFSFVRHWKPTLLFAVALKPIFFCEIISRIVNVPVLSMMTGLGFVFTSNTSKAKIIRPIIKQMLASSFKDKRNQLIMLNSDDVNWAHENLNMAKDDIRILPGIGVDIEKYKPGKEPALPFTIAYVGRMLKDKGLFELMDAARILKKNGYNLRIILAGAPDPSNPASIEASQIKQWEKEKLCEAFGHIADVPSFLRKAHVLALPSYREGMPTCILEAGASGLPCVATEVPGCKDAVINNETGLLVPAKNADALADAIQNLIDAPEKRRRLGANARRFVIDKFSQKLVVAKMLSFFDTYTQETN